MRDHHPVQVGTTDNFDYHDVELITRKVPLLREVQP